MSKPSRCSASARTASISKPTDHVRQRLAGHADVPIDLSFDQCPAQWRVVDEVVDRLLTRPAECVHLGVGNPGPPTLRIRVAQFPWGRLRSERVGPAVGTGDVRVGRISTGEQVSGESDVAEMTQ